MDWFALVVKPNHEKATVLRLGSRSYESYVPMYSTRRKWSDRMKLIDVPLFPGYVFCRFRFEERAEVLKMFGVLSLVGFGPAPATIAETEIERMQRIVSSGFSPTAWPIMHIGDRVRVCAGALTGIEGILAREKGREDATCRVVVNVEILQRAVAVEIDRQILQPVGNCSVLTCM